MANLDTRFGLKWVGSSLGVATNANVVPMYIASTYETALFVGDPVVVVAAGSNTAVEKGTTLGNYDIGTLPAIERASVLDDGTLSGVIMGFAPVTQDSVPYSAADTEGIAYVCTDPFALWEIQADGAVAASSVGLNAVGIYTHSGDTNTGLSGLELDSGTTTAPSADASNPFTIERIKASPDNEPNATWNKVIVRINGSTRMPGNPGEIGI